MFWEISRRLDEKTPVLSGNPAYKKETVCRLETDGYEVSRLTMGSHFGTHVDAPRHFYADGMTIDQIPPATFCGDAVLYRSNGPVDASFFEEKKMAPRVLLDIAPPYGLTEDGAWHLLMEGVLLVGVSGMDVENEGDEAYPCHRILLGAGIVIAEQLALEQVPEGEGRLTCLPLFIGDGDGAPARAIWEEKTDGNEGNTQLEGGRKGTVCG